MRLLDQALNDFIRFTRRNLRFPVSFAQRVELLFKQRIAMDNPDQFCPPKCLRFAIALGYPAVVT